VGGSVEEEEKEDRSFRADGLRRLVDEVSIRVRQEVPAFGACDEAVVLQGIGPLKDAVVEVLGYLGD